MTDNAQIGSIAGLFLLYVVLPFMAFTIVYEVIKNLIASPFLTLVEVFGAALMFVTPIGFGWITFQIVGGGLLMALAAFGGMFFGFWLGGELMKWAEEQKRLTAERESESQ